MLLSSPKIVFLGNEYDGKTDALQFTENAVSRYFKDRVITLQYNGAQKPLPAQDILSTDTEKTAEKIADAFKNHGVFRNKNNEVTPVMTVNEDAVKTAVTELGEENAPSADFYTVSLGGERQPDASPGGAVFEGIVKQYRKKLAYRFFVTAIGNPAVY